MIQVSVVVFVLHNVIVHSFMQGFAGGQVILATVLRKLKVMLMVALQHAQFSTVGWKWYPAVGSCGRRN